MLVDNGARTFTGIIRGVNEGEQEEEVNVHNSFKWLRVREQE